MGRVLTNGEGRGEFWMKETMSKVRWGRKAKGMFWGEWRMLTRKYRHWLISAKKEFLKRILGGSQSCHDGWKNRCGGYVAWNYTSHSSEQPQGQGCCHHRVGVLVHRTLLALHAGFCLGTQIFLQLFLLPGKVLCGAHFSGGMTHPTGMT